MIEKEFKGKIIGFSFTMYAFSIVEEVLNASFDDVLMDLQDNGESGKKKKPKIKIISAIMYAGAVNYCELKNLPIEFKINDVGFWLDEWGFEESMKLITEALKVMKIKNISPPQTEGVQKDGE